MRKLLQGRFDFEALRRRTFAVLVAHFARGLFASEQEQAQGGVGFGLGGVLALLATPGALVSLFLLEKYSSLIAFFRGSVYRFDPYKLSIADEYFFIVLSMTTIGLMVVLRWDRLLPNRRDSINLAILPIRARDIFLANLVALLCLATVFAIDINLVSTALFPLFVTMNSGTMLTLAHFMVAHAVTVFCASLFSFFSLFGFVGLLMAVLPRSWFRVWSTYIRIFLFVLLLATFFSNLLVQLFSGRISGGKTALLHALPGFWFLGIYQQLTGLATPQMVWYGRLALGMLAGSIIVSAVAYALCYSRHFAKLAESPSDIIGGSVHRPWLVGRWFGMVLFPNPFEKALCQFCIKALFRSEQQAMRFGAYLGLGLIWVADTALLPFEAGRSVPSDAVLSLSLLVSFFGVTGLLFVAGSPVMLEANWIFRSTVERADPSIPTVVEKLMLWAILPTSCTVAVASTYSSYGGKATLLHVLYTLVFTWILVTALAYRRDQIPFTCYQERDTRQTVLRMLGCLLSVIGAVPLLAVIEVWMLRRPAFMVAVLTIMVACLFVLRRQRGREPARALTFSESNRPFELLKLS